MHNVQLGPNSSAVERTTEEHFSKITSICSSSRIQRTNFEVHPTSVGKVMGGKRLPGRRRGRSRLRSQEEPWWGGGDDEEDASKLASTSWLSMWRDYEADAQRGGIIPQIIIHRERR